MKLVAFGVVVLLLAGGVIYYMSREPAAAPASAPVVATAPEPAAVTAPVRETAAPPGAGPAKAPEARKSTPRKADPVPASAPAPATTTLATLMLETDIAGASVFVNREYAGTTPLRIDRLAPGSKQLKLTADGFEGIERTVELAAGENPITLRFKEVRLSKRVPVSHKHGMGGCEGTLAATVDGLAYETSNKNDAFTLPYAQLETFVVDYLEKNLRVKQKGGKTWNFTDKAATNADALFVFHRDVEAARKKLAEGYAPVR